MKGNQKSKMKAVEPKTIIDIKQKYLKINDSTTISIASNDKFDAQNNIITWGCNIGTIKGFGKRITFISPNFKGMAIIEAKITDKDNNVYAESVKILVYKQLIMLKADDFGYKRKAYSVLALARRFKKMILSRGVSGRFRSKSRWKKFTDFVVEKEIKASLGLIGNFLENNNIGFISYTKKLLQTGFFEIFNHGYDHKRIILDQETGVESCEFKNTQYEYQKSHILKTQELVKNKLKLNIHTFGAPENAIDDTTNRVISEINNIKVWYFGLNNSDKLTLPRVSNIEFPFFHPNYLKFKANYNCDKPYLVLQIHPTSWNKKRFDEFKKIIEYLIAMDVTFINPYEYYLLTTN